DLRAGGLCRVTERTAGGGMSDAEPTGSLRDHRLDVARASFRVVGGEAHVVPDPARDEDPAGIEQDVDETQPLRLGHAPGMHVLAADAVSVVALTLQHGDMDATASQDQRQGRPGDASADDDDVAPHDYSALPRAQRSHLRGELDEAGGLVSRFAMC